MEKSKIPVKVKQKCGLIRDLEGLKVRCCGGNSANQKEVIGEQKPSLCGPGGVQFDKKVNLWTNYEFKVF